ncbi:MAG: hypothetical protein R2744_07245, partial [Bacteroidales bacterium]
ESDAGWFAVKIILNLVLVGAAGALVSRAGAGALAGLVIIAGAGIVAPFVTGLLKVPDFRSLRGRNIE